VLRVILIGLVLAGVGLPGAVRAEGCNGFLAGVNGILTSPADIVYEAVVPPDMFEELPGAPVSTHFLGFVSGIFSTVNRIGWGTVDIVLTPFWVVPTLSPKPVIEIVPFYEIEYEV